MRAIAISLALVLLTAATLSQQPAGQSAPPAIKTFASSAEVMALLAQAKSERKEGQPVVSEHILQLAPYNAGLEDRASVGSASVHEKEAELMYVIDGSATLVTGGKLVNETRTNPDNLSGTAIAGGMSQTLSKGDFIIVPENTPHWFSAFNGGIALMTLHVPRPVPGAGR